MVKHISFSIEATYKNACNHDYMHFLFSTDQNKLLFSLWLKLLHCLLEEGSREQHKLRFQNHQVG